MREQLPLSPIQRYMQDLNKEGFAKDAAQKVAVDKLQVLYENLIEDENIRKKDVSKWFNKFTKKHLNLSQGSIFGVGWAGGKLI